MKKSLSFIAATLLVACAPASADPSHYSLKVKCSEEQYRDAKQFALSCKAADDIKNKYCSVVAVNRICEPVLKAPSGYSLAPRFFSPNRKYNNVYTPVKNTVSDSKLVCSAEEKDKVAEAVKTCTDDFGVCMHNYRNLYCGRQEATSITTTVTEKRESSL